MMEAQDSRGHPPDCQCSPPSFQQQPSDTPEGTAPEPGRRSLTQDAMPLLSPLLIPFSTATIGVHIINTTFSLSDLPTSYFFGPDIPGYSNFKCLAYSFLLTHHDAKTGKDTKMLFDLGAPRNWQQDLAEPLAKRIEGWGATISVDEYVSDILEKQGHSLDSIDTLIWSHPHWDHMGKPSLFPNTTELVFGPGVKEAFAPGYPENPDAPFKSTEWAGRTVTELDFNSSTLKIGGLPAIDYFRDGSLYFLSAPGHMIGHFVALARTTAPSCDDLESTFLLMGADTYHHAGELRPHKGAPLPATVTLPAPKPTECPGELFEKVHPAAPERQSLIPEQYRSYVRQYMNDTENTPFYTVGQDANGATVATNITEGRANIRALQGFDADPRVLVIAAHDQSMENVVSYLPHSANNWHKQGWKESGRWLFLQDLLPSIHNATKKD